MKRALIALLLASAPALAQAETIAITGGRVVIGDGSAPIDGGTVVVRDGIVDAAGRGIAVPAGARTVDATGKWVTPGIVAGFSRVGLVEVSAVDETSDSSADKSRFSAALDVAPAVNPNSSPIAVSRTAGITRAIVSPGAGGTIFGGLGAVIDLGEDSDPITAPRVFEYVEFGEAGTRLAGGSRAANHLLFRAMLREAAQYERGLGFDDELLTAEDARALREVVAGRTMLFVHVEGANDILQVLALRADYPQIKLVIVGATEGWRVAPQIAAAGIPVIASALSDLPDSFDRLAATQSNIGRMKDAGVTVAIGMINDDDTHQIRYAPQYAGNLVALTRVPGATGLSWDEAFAAISSVPAQIVGMGGRIGVLQAGAMGDVVVWDGDPLELSSAPELVLIDGVEQSLENRQTRLRDRYRTPQESELPKAYEH